MHMHVPHVSRSRAVCAHTQFDSYDHDHSGVISFHELHRMLRRDASWVRKQGPAYGHAGSHVAGRDGVETPETDAPPAVRPVPTPTRRGP